MWLTLYAWTELLYIDFVGLRGFSAIQRAVTGTHTRARSKKRPTLEAVVNAIDLACSLYIKQARCLQRSAVATRLLRRHGIAADLVIGCQLPAPLRAHAWVEVAGEVVGDDLDDLEFFRVLDRW